MLITLQFGPFNSKSKLKIYPGQKNDDISSKLIAKQGVILYMATPGVKYPNFDQKTGPKYRYYANNTPIWLI